MSAVSIRCYVNTCSETIVNMTEFAEWAPCKTLLFTRKYPISNEKTIRLCFTHFLIYFYILQLIYPNQTISIGKIKYVSIYFIFVMVFFYFHRDRAATISISLCCNHVIWKNNMLCKVRCSFRSGRRLLKYLGLQKGIRYFIYSCQCRNK